MLSYSLKWHLINVWIISYMVPLSALWFLSCSSSSLWSVEVPEPHTDTRFPLPGTRKRCCWACWAKKGRDWKGKFGQGHRSNCCCLMMLSRNASLIESLPFPWILWSVIRFEQNQKSQLHFPVSGPLKWSMVVNVYTVHSGTSFYWGSQR